MTQFTRPQGINFSCRGDLSAATLSGSLCQTASFLQSIAPYARLHKYEDWWEHDGLHFYREEIDFNRVFEMVNSPRSLSAVMPGDEDVFVGVAPGDGSWYLRFYVSWDDEGFELIGRFDITLPQELAEQYQSEVASALGVGMKRQDAEAYYQTIT